MPIRFLTEESVDPYHNLAKEWVLTKHAVRGTCILYLWQNQRTIVIGRNQDPLSECRAEAFQGSGGKIARRKSGGGAVFHDLGNLNYSFIHDLRDPYGNAYREVLLTALAAAGIQAEFSGRNDILVRGRKISGYASYETGTRCCRHGTLLLNTDIAEMERWLTPDLDKMERHRIRSVSSRVINLQEIRKDLSVEKMIRLLADASGGLWLEGAPDSGQVAEAEKHFADQEWIMGGRE